MSNYYLECNGFPIVGGSIMFPKNGRFSGSFYVETDEELTDDLELRLDDQVIQATKVRSEVYAESSKVFFVAGKNGLRKTLSPKYYTNATIETIITEALHSLGEELSPDSDESILSRMIPKFSRVKGTGSALLKYLSEEYNFCWCFTDDGKLKIFAESYTENDSEFETLAHDTSTATLVFSGSNLSARPFQKIAGKQISEVMIEIQDDDLCVVAQYGDGLAGAFASAVKRLLPNLSPFCFYLAKVVRQSSDLKLLECVPYGDALPQLTKVPLHATAGSQIKITAGSTVLIGFIGGKLGEPYAIATSLTACDEIKFTAASKIVFDSPLVDLFNGAGVPLARKGSVISGTATVSGMPAPFTALISTGSETVRG